MHDGSETTPTLHFPELQLDFLETRVLGAMLEKETTTPKYYPMTLNGVETACNQSSNRNPVTELSETEVEETLQRLRDKKLALRMNVAGSRVPKYKHILNSVLDLSSAENAVMTVLLLRGIQTAGEIKQRTERMHPFETVEQVENTLQGFIEYGNGPLVQEIPSGHGRRVKTYAHLLGGEPALTVDRESPQTITTTESIVENEKIHWKTKMEREITDLKEELSTVHEQLDIIRNKLNLSDDSQTG